MLDTGVRRAQADVRPAASGPRHPLVGAIRGVGQLLYLGALVSVAGWGARAAWAFTSSAAREIIVVRHPDILAHDPMLDAVLRGGRPRPGTRRHRTVGHSRSVVRR